MPLIPVQLPAGIARQGTAYETPGRWWDMSLMRWQAGNAVPIGGWQRLTATPFTGTVHPIDPPRRIFTWKDNANQTVVLVGTDEKLRLDFGDYIDITPLAFVPPLPQLGGGYGSGAYGTGAYGTVRPPSAAFSEDTQPLWSIDNWGQDAFIVASSDGRLLRYTHGAVDPRPVAQTGAPTGNQAVIVTDERHVMLIGTTTGGTFYGRRIAWCSREDPTDWNFASVTNTAGFLDLDATSPLLLGCNVLGGNLVFSSTDVFSVTYQGLPYIYGAQKISEIERLHPYTVATWDGKAMWWTSRGFQIFSGGTVQSVPCPVFNDLRDDLHPVWGPVRSHGSHNGNFPEVWFHYPDRDSVSGECNRYVAYNYLENYWHWGELSRTAMVSAGATDRPLMGGADGHMYEHENGYTDAGVPLIGKRWLESGALGISDGSQLAEVRQAILATTNKLPGGGPPIDITFYGHLTPDGAERAFGPYTPRGDGYTDTRVNTREARIRYTGRVDAAFTVGTLRLDVGVGGTR